MANMSEESKYPRTVFVLDVSGSMGGMKCQTLHLSAIRVIEDIPDNGFVGIVLFDNTTNIEHKVVQITNRSVRDSLIAKVPQMARGGTDIGSGLLMALQALTQESVSTVGATIFLVTDGEDLTGGNYVDRVLPTLIAAKVRIVCIAIGNSADENLERLSKATNGNIYIASDTNREMAARVIESTIQEVKTTTELSEALIISVSNDFVTISQQIINKNVIIDCDIGRNTIFTVSSEDIDKISLTIISPNGLKYDSTSNEFTRNLSLKRYQLKLKTAETGVWTISLVKHSKQAISATISVSSQPINPNAIQMRAVLKDADINSQTPPIIIAQIIKGNNAVIGAQVMAIIDKPNGTQIDLKLNNYDNIYCNYFTDYCGSGRYNVSVLAKSGTNNCQLKSINDRNYSVNQTVPQFERQLIAGCFKVEDFMPSKPLNDLKLQELSLSTTFNSLSMNTNSMSLQIESPAPRTAKAIINAKKVIQQTDDIKLSKEKLWNLLLKVKKSINSAKISELEKNSMKNTIEEINSFITSKKCATINDFETYHKILEEMNRKLS